MGLFVISVSNNESFLHEEISGNLWHPFSSSSSW
jgi:hypothetical protein